MNDNEQQDAYDDFQRNLRRRTEATVPAQPTISDIAGMIIEYETGAMDEEDIHGFFQLLVDTGTINHLQGHYQRMAYQLMVAGWIS